MATVPTEVSEIDFVGDGSNTLFPVPFPIQDTSDLVVELDGDLQVEGVDYTVDAAPSDSPNVTMLAAPASPLVLHVERTVAIVQLINLLTQGAMSPATFTKMYDKRCYVEQQLDRRLRAIEALTVVSSVTELDQVLVSKTFTTAAEVEDTFPVIVDLPAGSTATGVNVVRAENLTDDAAVFDEAVFPDWEPGVDSVQLNNVTGLLPNTAYRIAFQVILATVLAVAAGSIVARSASHQNFESLTDVIHVETTEASIEGSFYVGLWFPSAQAGGTYSYTFYYGCAPDGSGGNVWSGFTFTPTGVGFVEWAAVSLSAPGFGSTYPGTWRVEFFDPSSALIASHHFTVEA